MLIFERKKNMFQWMKLSENQYLGFWSLGLLLFFMQEIPYMVMPFLKLETNPIMHMQESSVLLDACEKILGSLCIVFMTFLVHSKAEFFSVKTGKEVLFFSIAAGILMLNLFGWLLYFTGHQSMIVMMFYIVILPPSYYIFIGLWRNNTILAVTGGIFLIVHFVHVLGNLRLG